VTIAVHLERGLHRAFLAAATFGDSSGLRQTYGDALKTRRLVIAANGSALSDQAVHL